MNNYRTYDSVLVNGVSWLYWEIYADEGLMVHSGELYLIMYLTKCRWLNVLGDRK